MQSWLAMVLAWEKNKKKPDPYVEPKAGTMSNTIKAQLQKEDDLAAAQGHLLAHEVTPAAFLQTGLELEES
ncbi:hypothetical protein EWM64_g7900, partial [Hericium alpestre]